MINSGHPCPHCGEPGAWFKTAESYGEQSCRLDDGLLLWIQTTTTQWACRECGASLDLEAECPGELEAYGGVYHRRADIRFDYD